MSVSIAEDPASVAVALAEALEKRQISYAIGGALAYSFWGIPRATMDVDINLFLATDQLEDVFDALRELGFGVDADAARIAAEARGMFEAKAGPMRIDLFVPSIPFSWEAERTRKQQRLDGKTVWVLSAEAVAVFKLLFFRPKDILDIERLIAVQGGALDVAYVRGHIVEMMGQEDPRVARWDALVSEHGAPR